MKAMLLDKPGAPASWRANEPGAGPVHADRRHALGVLRRAAGVGAAASVPLLLWPSDGFALCGQCKKNADGGVGFVCKNPAPVNSGKVCNECVSA